MKTILNIGYGKTVLHNQFQQGVMSSRLQYGIEEIRLGKTYAIVDCPLNNSGGIVGLVINNFKAIQNADVVYLSYIYESPLLLLFLLKNTGILKRTIIGVSHKTVQNDGRLWERIMRKFIYHSFDKILFHSRKNMEESILAGMIDSSQAEFLYWGDDLTFVDKTFPEKPMGDFFISTGRENRDYDTLIKAFCQSPWKIEIYTNRKIGDNCYDELSDLLGCYKNVAIQFVDKSNETTLALARRLSECRCVTIPLMKDKIDYCVGLTSVVEAMAYGKPIISTYNPYSPIDIEKEQIGFFVQTVEDWRKAISFIMENPDEASAMGQRARKLAEEQYNIQQCARQVERLMGEILK